MENVPFNKPYLTGKELQYISEAHQVGRLSGDGPFTQKCHLWLEANLSVKKSLLTHSCTAALEMTALLLNIKEGDEIIMPSYTFVSTANAFVIRGGVPVFVDVRNDTFNLDETLIEEAITERTRAIVVVHYAGVSCAMDVISEIAKKYNLIVIEDAAQGLMSSYKGKPLGSLGDLGAVSFHETKNIICGEGGALFLNNSDFIERAEILREKGTNRSKFFRGAVDKYSWVDIGSSYLPGELVAAFLYAQLEEAKRITESRMYSWNIYHEALEYLEIHNIARRPKIPMDCEHNAHMYYIVLNSLEQRTSLMKKLESRGIKTVFHYVPLHNSSAGKKYGRYVGNMESTIEASECLLRLPQWLGVDAEFVAQTLLESVGEK